MLVLEYRVPELRGRGLIIAAVAATCVAAGGGYFAWKTLGASAEAESGPQPVPVRVAEAAVLPLAIHVKALGSVAPLNTVNVRSQVAGELTHVSFAEGQMVQRGQLLARIDPRPFEAQVAEAHGQSRQNEAQLRYAQEQLQIYRGLADKQIVAQTRLDQQLALVEQHGGAVAADRGRLANARIQLDRTRITAPIAGRIGLRRADPGNILSGGADEIIAVITQTRPISVLFSAPEARLPEIRNALAKGGGLEVSLWDRAERAELARGKLSNLDNQIDPQTGAVRLRATFANDDESLFPNQFVNVRLTVGRLDNAVTAPDAAIQQGSTGPYAWVVDKTGAARLRKLTTGPSSEGVTAVHSGLAAGDRVVIEGLDRLSEGRKVQIIAQPDAQAVPAKS